VTVEQSLGAVRLNNPPEKARCAAGKKSLTISSPETDVSINQPNVPETTIDASGVVKSDAAAHPGKLLNWSEGTLSYHSTPAENGTVGVLQPMPKTIGIRRVANWRSSRTGGGSNPGSSDDVGGTLTMVTTVFDDGDADDTRKNLRQRRDRGAGVCTEHPTEHRPGLASAKQWRRNSPELHGRLGRDTFDLETTLACGTSGCCLKQYIASMLTQANLRSDDYNGLEMGVHC